MVTFDVPALTARLGELEEERVLDGGVDLERVAEAEQLVEHFLLHLLHRRALLLDGLLARLRQRR